MPVATGAAAELDTPTPSTALVALEETLLAELMPLEAREAAVLDRLLKSMEAEVLKLASEEGSVMEAELLARLAAMDEESLAREAVSEEVRLDSTEATEEMTLDAEEVG